MMSALISVNCPRGLGAGPPEHKIQRAVAASPAPRSGERARRVGRAARGVGPPRRRSSRRSPTRSGRRRRARARGGGPRRALLTRATPARLVPAQGPRPPTRRGSARLLADGSRRSLRRDGRRPTAPTRTRTPKRPNASRDMVSPGAHVARRAPQRRTSTSFRALGEHDGAFGAGGGASGGAAAEASSPHFPAVFWAVAHALRLTFWACTARLMEQPGGVWAWWATACSARRARRSPGDRRPPQRADGGTEASAFLG